MSDSIKAVSRGDAGVRIGAVAERTGLTTHTIRVWERRYNAVEPSRTGGGTRVYSESQVTRLSLLKRLTDLGHGISALADLAEPQLRQLLPRDATLPKPSAPGETVHRIHQAFFAALENLDTDALEAVLSRATLNLAPRDVVIDLAGPLAQEVGRRWQGGSLTIAQEHAATSRLRDLLSRMRSSYASLAAGPRIVAATLPGERHELGLLMATVLAAMRGFSAVYLGVDLPLAELVDAVERSKADALLLSLVHCERLPAQAMLRELRQQIPETVEIIAGGHSVAGLDVPRIRFHKTLEDFDGTLELLAAASPAEPEPRFKN